MGIRETWEKFFLSTEYGIGYKYRYNRRPTEYMFFFDKHTLSGETLSGEIFVGRNYSSGEIFVTKRKIRHFRPTKSFAQ